MKDVIRLLTSSTRFEPQVHHREESLYVQLLCGTLIILLLNASQTYLQKFHIQMDFLMMNTRGSNHVENQNIQTF
jgi:hypothetical protein